MRLLLRLILTWLVLLPIGLYFALPTILSHFQQQLGDEAHTQCLEQTSAAPASFDPSRPEIAQSYCQCLRDGVVLTRADLLDLIRRRPPAQMQATLQTHIDRCTDRLHNPAPSDAQIITFP